MQLMVSLIYNLHKLLLLCSVSHFASSSPFAPSFSPILLSHSAPLLSFIVVVAANHARKISIPFLCVCVCVSAAFFHILGTFFPRSRLRMTEKISETIVESSVLNVLCKSSLCSVLFHSILSVIALSSISIN